VRPRANSDDGRRKGKEAFALPSGLRSRVAAADAFEVLLVERQGSAAAAVLLLADFDSAFGAALGLSSGGLSVGDQARVLHVGAPVMNRPRFAASA
jgi:hypothetical protein